MEAQCPRCSAQNPSEAIFCASCGHQLRSALSRESGPLDLSRKDSSIGPAESSPPAAPFVAPPPPPAPKDRSTPGSTADWPPPGGVQQSAPASAQPAHGSAYASTSAAPAYDYGGGYTGGYGSVPPYGAAPLPPDGNTSGMGPGYMLPRETQGWTFAGCVPFGLFAFLNGSVLWGLLYWLLGFFGAGIVYSIYVGIKGREMAWQGRRFDSLQQFEETMAAWNRWGLIFTVIAVLGTLLYFIGMMALVMVSAANDWN